jgi:hypothetical protein
MHFPRRFASIHLGALICVLYGYPQHSAVLPVLLPTTDDECMRQMG